MSIFRRSCYVLVATLLAITMTGCMDASLVDSGSAPATISIQAAPPTTRDVGLRVSGPGMATLQKTVPVGADAGVFQVPVGPSRRFELRARLNRIGTDVLNESVRYTAFWEGPLPPGGTMVALSPRIETALLIPDRNSSGGNAGRIVAVDNLLGSDTTITSDKWRSAPFDDPGLQDPVDVDIGPAGAIYVAFASVGIARISDVDNLSYSQVRPAGNVNAIAIDRERSRLFVAEDAEVYGRALPGTGAGASLGLFSSLDPATHGYFQGVAVDPFGMIYVAQSARISRVDPVSGDVLASRNVAPRDVSDIMVRPDGVYVLVHSDNQTDGAATQVVIRFSPNLQTVLDTFGTGVSPVEGQPGRFFGAIQFIAPWNDRITIADTDGSSVARIIQIDDVSGSGWREYGAYNSAFDGTAGEFNFVDYLWGGF